MFKLSDEMTRTIRGVPSRLKIDERWITAMHAAAEIGVTVPAAAFDAAAPKAIWGHRS